MGVNLTSIFYQHLWLYQSTEFKMVTRSLRLGAGLLVASGLAYIYNNHRAARQVFCAEKQQLKCLPRFYGRTAVITGAAGDIGSATAESFAVQGASVVLVDLPKTTKVLQDLASRLRELGATAVLVAPGDVTNKDDILGVIEKSLETYGEIDYYFNNAGIQGQLLPIHLQDEKMFKTVSDINIYGVFLGIKYASRAMIQSKKGGVIINTSSLAGLLGPPNMAAYAASKHAVIGLTKTAAKDLAQYGIRVCAVSPGLLEGRMWSSQVRGQARCRKDPEGKME